MTNRSSILLFLVTAALGCGSAQAPAGPETASATEKSPAEASPRAQANARWNTDLARLLDNPLVTPAYEARLSELAARTPTALQCEEITRRVELASRPSCNPVSDPLCPRPSDMAPDGAALFDHECPAVQIAPGDEGVSHEQASLHEGCSAAWITWLFARCPE